MKHETRNKKQETGNKKQETRPRSRASYFLTRAATSPGLLPRSNLSDVTTQPRIK
jgi:hypothetical protein